MLCASPQADDREERCGESRARAVAYRALAHLFRPPSAGKDRDPLAPELPRLREALLRLGASPGIRRLAAELEARLRGLDPGTVRRSYEATFEPSGGLRCPPYETSHTRETPQHGLTRNFEMADIAGFYRAFGVEMEPGSERPDHVSAELEFMHLLAVKEAVAAGEKNGSEAREICRDASRGFLRDHLGRWTGRLAEALAREAADPLWALSGRLLAGFVELDRQRLDGA